MCCATKDQREELAKNGNIDFVLDILLQAGKFLELILYLVDAEYIALAKLACHDHGRRLSIEEKVAVIEKFLEINQIDFARTFRYQHLLGAVLPKNHPVIKATSTRNKKGGE